MRTFLPSIYGEGVEPQAECEMVEQAAQFAAWWLYRLGDKRDRMVMDCRLVKAAQDHADWLAQHHVPGVTMHLGKDGSTANRRVRAAGYRLLEWHGDGNTIESATRSWDAINEAVDDLMASPPHHDHMNVKGWYSDHTVYGFGFADQFYICLICPPEE